MWFIRFSVSIYKTTLFFFFPSWFILTHIPKPAHFISCFGLPHGLALGIFPMMWKQNFNLAVGGHYLRCKSSCSIARALMRGFLPFLVTTCPFYSENLNRGIPNPQNGSCSHCSSTSCMDSPSVFAAKSLGFGQKASGAGRAEWPWALSAFDLLYRAAHLLAPTLLFAMDKLILNTSSCLTCPVGKLLCSATHMTSSSILVAEK